MLSALKVPGYLITELIHDGLNTIVYRGVSQSNSEKVILKVLKGEYPSLEEISRLKHEYSITQNLDIEGIVKVVRLEAQVCHYILVLEDFGGISLQNFLASERLSLVSFLCIAIQLSKSLISLHTHHIIHKDVKPSNIIINPESGIVKLTDFSIASRLSQEAQLISLSKLEGTLAYISPEQTGRMNRAVDYRSDFYSLGVTFYEMLTGQLPFQSDDALEIVHCHIAKQPPSILDFNPNVPLVIAAIITKLMAKNAEDRYQSAAGLLADLQRCLDELKDRGKITEFLPGESDRISQLNIPQKLYGRGREVETLLAGFDAISQGESQLMLVAGYSGIGKSSLVNEVHKPIVRQRGYFISGKFDQFQRAVPYASLIQAFQSLMRQLLVENATQLKSWKEKLSRALGNNGQVIIDVIPELELIIGVQPPVVELGAMERQNRFNQVFCTFVGVFTQKEHPLVIFLDDLQWADIASLKLMQRLITDNNSQYLLLIAAYRDNEVSPTHPFIQTVEEIQKTDTTINRITLENLNISQVQQLVNDTFNITDNSITQGLASLLFNKTLGNPFFLTQLIKTIYQEKLIKYDFDLKCWDWNLQQIQSVGITNLSIVELMASNISKLPAATQSALQLAACIGAFFKLDVLATVTEKSASDIIKSLWPALQQGLILPLSHNYQVPTEQLLLICDESVQKLDCGEIELEFKFLHDRVQQAAYSLIPEEGKQTIHLRIGKLLLGYFSSSELEAHILDIVNHFNMGANLLSSQVEKEELAFLNLLASRKAKTANAYHSSAEYLNTGIQLLPDNSWQSNYDLTLNLYVELIEAEYLNTNFDRLQQLCEIVLIHANNILDTIKVYEVKIQSCNSQLRPELAIEIGLDVLNKLGVTLALTLPKNIDVEQLENLPQIQDAYQIAVLKILNNLTYSTYQTAPDLYLKLIYTMADICIHYGNSETAAFAYACCSLVCEVQGEVDLGYQYGLLSLLILDKFNAITFAPKVLTTYNVCVRHWKEHGKFTLNAFSEAFNLGVEAGDIEYACFASIYFCLYSFLTGEALPVVDEKYRKYLDYVKSVKQEFSTHCFEIWHQLALNLQVFSQNSYRLIGDSFNEDELLPILIEKNQLHLLFGVYFSKLMLAYLFQKYEQAIQYSRLAEKYAVGASATMMIVHHNFYYSLALLKHYPNVSVEEQEEYLATVIANQSQMKIWSFHCAANNQHKYDLVEAEKCRILSQYWEATQLYNRAIELASENGYIQEQAIASELAGEFYLASGNMKIASLYLTDAYYGYQQWGATAKVKDLESRYPYLTLRKRESMSPTTTTTTTTQTTNNYSSLDSATIIKASRTLSSEIVISNLLTKLMHLLRENAGGQKVCFISKQDKQLFLEAVLGEDNEVKVLQSIPISECNILPLSLINYLQHTLTPLVLDNATQSDFSTDSYIEANQVLSVLVFPVIHQSKLQGILYLENNLTKAAFTQDRIELLSVITAQAAISIENARFYTTLENRVAERTQELAERNQELQATLEKLHQTQIKLIQTEKMSSLGQLVAGVAHEINNPINFIYGNLTHTHQYTQSLFELIKLYQKNYPKPVAEICDTIEEIDLDFIQDDLPQILSSMKNGAGRIKNIVLSLRNFARLDEADRKTVNIHEGLDNTLMILHQKLEAIQLIKEYANLPEVYCFAGELNQVFMHLLNNAIDAVASTTINTPTIWIRTGVRENNQIAISIIDNGAGIKPEIQSKIFDPFFTTKPVGHGTGLGLSISHQIVQQHKGQLLCSSELGVGTEFTILLPY